MAITLASDSATTIAGFRPSKVGSLSVNSPALILSKTSGVSWLKLAKNRLKSARNRQKNRLNGEVFASQLRHRDFTPKDL